MSQGYLLGGCEAPEADDAVVDATGGDGEVEGDPRAWTGYTSEESPPLICRNNQAVRGADCNGNYCDDIALDCRATGHNGGQHSWQPYFSEEGSGNADEGHCVGGNQWVTGLNCRGSYCDDLSIRCTQIIGSSTGPCTWSTWYSEEQGPFTAPAGYFIKGIECDGSYCDNKRYRHCRMN